MATKKREIERSREQVNEIKRCGSDPVYFIKKYVYVRHPIKGVIPFDLYPFQEDCLRAFKQHRFNVSLKSRQIGITTVTAAYVVWMCLFQKDKNILVIATKLETAQGFIDKVKLALERIPEWLMLPTYTPTTQKVQFSNGSRVTAVATSDSAGRSEAVTFLIVDECVSGDTIVSVRDKLTSEEFKISVAELHYLLKLQQQNIDYIYVEDADNTDNSGV